MLLLFFVGHFLMPCSPVSSFKTLVMMRKAFLINNRWELKTGEKREIDDVFL